MVRVKRACGHLITEQLLRRSGAEKDNNLGRWSWPPVVDGEVVTHLSVVPLADHEWMLDISQRDRHEPQEPNYPTAIGLPVRTMEQLIELLHAIYRSLIPRGE